MKRISIFGTVLLASLTASCTTAPTIPSEPTSPLVGERILSFHSEAIVREDGWIDITETIAVRAEGSNIKRGIYRNLPTIFWDSDGYRHEVAYEPLTVSRNDVKEDFHTIESTNGIRTYFGRADRILAPGVHTYAFRYRVNRMLRFLDDHDELYWNVTGSYWGFPIDNASATVVLELGSNVTIQSADAFVGAMGTQSKEYVTTREGPASVKFQSKEMLEPGEGMTIVVAWPKGRVIPPTSEQVN